jgi:hypothetical protein
MPGKTTSSSGRLKTAATPSNRTDATRRLTIRCCGTGRRGLTAAITACNAANRLEFLEQERRFIGAPLVHEEIS